MKKISNIIVLGLCLAAFFTSCVKEENYVREIAELSVSLVSAGSGSIEQGDAIKDAWIWAFDCTLDTATGVPTISDTAKAVAGRYVYGLSNYGSISIHVPLPICDGSRSFLLVAVVNTQAYGNFSLTSESTWGAIKAATFGNGGAFWSTYPKDSEFTPEVMPISNWTTFTVTSNNTHAGSCYQLNLPVYRTVAKAQFSVAKASESFDLDILDVKVVANSGYETGALLTANAESATGSNNEKIQRGKPDAAATTWWWASPTAVPTTNTPAEGETVAEGEGETEPAIKYQLKNSDSGFSVVNDITTVVPVANHNEIGNATYTWIGSTFLFENNNDAPYSDLGCFDEAQGDGYNLYVKYTVDDGDPIEVYTPLGKVVRNHDYQVRALVDAGGKMSLTLYVNDWEPVPNNWNFTDNVTVTQKLQWAAGTDKETVTIGEGAAAEPVTQVTLPQTNSNTTNKAECSFNFNTPRDGAKWMASFVGGDVNAFKFIDADGNLVNTISGLIDGTQSTLKICTTDAVVRDTKQAYLDIVVVTGDGRTLSATAAVFEDGKRPLLVQELTM